MDYFGEETTTHADFGESLSSFLIAAAVNCDRQRSFAKKYFLQHLFYCKKCKYKKKVLKKSITRLT